MKSRIGKLRDVLGEVVLQHREHIAKLEDGRLPRDEEALIRMRAECAIASAIYTFTSGGETPLRAYLPSKSPQSLSNNPQPKNPYRKD